METSKFNSSSSARGGRNNTKTILTAAGLSGAVGLASGAAIFKFGLKKKDKKEEQNHQEEKPENNVAENVAGQENSPTQQPEKPQQEQLPEQSQHQEPVSNENITTPQPTDVTNGNGGQQPAPSNNGTTQENPAQPVPQNNGTAQENPVQPTGTDDVNPDVIAQQIASSDETDPNDIDAPDVITVDGMDVAIGPDGTEVPVAMVRTPDGGQYMLADIDGDGVFSDIFDMEGNYVGEVEGNLTASDLQEAIDPNGGYMAFTGNEPMGEDPTGDIIATAPTGSATAAADPSNTAVAENEEIPDVDDLLEQLLSSNDDSLAEASNSEMLVDSGGRDGLGNINNSTEATGDYTDDSDDEGEADDNDDDASDDENSDDDE